MKTQRLPRTVISSSEAAKVHSHGGEHVLTLCLTITVFALGNLAVSWALYCVVTRRTIVYSWFRVVSNHSLNEAPQRAKMYYVIVSQRNFTLHQYDSEIIMQASRLPVLGQPPRNNFVISSDLLHDLQRRNLDAITPRQIGSSLPKVMIAQETCKIEMPEVLPLNGRALTSVDDDRCRTCLGFDFPGSKFQIPLEKLSVSVACNNCGSLCRAIELLDAEWLSKWRSNSLLHIEKKGKNSPFRYGQRKDSLSQ
jgi:hypothetical protein